MRNLCFTLPTRLIFIRETWRGSGFSQGIYPLISSMYRGIIDSYFFEVFPNVLLQISCCFWRKFGLVDGWAGVWWEGEAMLEWDGLL